MPKDFAFLNVLGNNKNKIARNNFPHLVKNNKFHIFYMIWEKRIENNNAKGF